MWLVPCLKSYLEIIQLVRVVQTYSKLVGRGGRKEREMEALLCYLGAEAGGGHLMIYLKIWL